MLYVVRHAMPAVSPDVPPERWPLDDGGRRAAAALDLPPDALLVSSTEPKARQTLEPAGPVVVDARFDEVARDEPFDGDYRARRRAYVGGTDHPGWEPRERVVARFAAGVGEWLERAGGRTLVIGTHGMAMTLWLASVTELTDAAGFWDGLRLPDVFELDLDGRRRRRPVAEDGRREHRGEQAQRAGDQPRARDPQR
jgi:broad specificity phosphatase PhoE